MKPLIYISLGMFLFCVAGCQNAIVPKDFPKTFPATVTVKDGETPLADVMILLYTQEAQGSWASSGTSDANGVAALVTNQGNYMAKGVPAGTYKVTLTKTPKAPSEKSADEVAAMSYEEQAAYSQKISEELAKMPSPISQALTNPKATPLTLEVTATDGKLIVDLAQYK